jgi:hypothetical protein
MSDAMKPILFVAGVVLWAVAYFCAVAGFVAILT